MVKLLNLSNSWKKDKILNIDELKKMRFLVFFY